jgi:hypothetical protein
MRYTIYSGQFEKGTQEQQAVFSQLLGAENTQYKFDFYFHWYNIIHEYGHCLCEHYRSATSGLKQEFLVNRFAVSIWQYAGYEQALNELQKIINETLQRMENPVPAHLSFDEYYEQIWGTEALMQVPIYGYFQFKSVERALANRENLETVLREIGIHKAIGNPPSYHKKYHISAATAKEVLQDIKSLLDKLGIEQPFVAVELVENPSIQCANHNVGED